MDNYFDRCKSCKFYIKHYILEGCGYREITGHCVNSSVPRKYQRCPIKFENCPFWQKNEDTPQRRQEIIRSVICNMNEKLSDILNILENDKLS